MENLVIIGARPFGREICNYARDAGFRVKGFLDDKADALAGFQGYPPVLESAEAYCPSPDDVFVCAVGDSHARRKYVGIIARKGGSFVSVVHPSAYVGPNVRMGVGCVVGPYAMVDCDLVLGDHVDVNSFAYVPHDCNLAAFVTLSPGCRLGGGTVIGEGSFLGLGAIVLPKVRVGSNVCIAAGAVVTRDVPDDVLTVGVPAVVRRKIDLC